ncbi:sugar phosphate isomerase/epimerase family protein [Sphingobacterium pedocola]|uniref:Sugar phosphate isomerase/epimerase n=1 Tax=Sphingobacterium pedocola TaxID=2082722 RepID=A0ABR9TDC4_9SPHI|nr:sugar phosphate isomerase/epimerase family protein [Sphingobacterium pedocola]MBE8723057.1 sugar phosphate isomerase/epimerase [Sphingobacterium pedocola]
MKQITILLLFAFAFQKASYAQSTLPELGVCVSVAQSALVKKAGYTFIQPTVSEVLQPTMPDSSFHGEKVKNSEVSVSVVNVFIPGTIKTTGPEVDEAAVMNYATTVFQRAQRLNIPLIVFGSGASRHIPEGFNRDTAFVQFVHISKKLAALAAQYHVVLALESQNKEECNFLNTLKECIAVADAVNHPNFKITVDIYHMMRENEPAAVILEGAKYIYHCDIGEKENRTAPGVIGDDFTAFFSAFQKIGYTGKIALECRFKDLEAELPLALRTIREQWKTASNKR